MGYLRHSQKIYLLILLVGIGIILPSYGRCATVDGPDQAATDIVQLINTISKLVSRAWIVPAQMAWALMTNSFVYGSSFFLDAQLFRFWQIIRTFCFYAVGFLLVGNILRAFFNPEKGMAKIWEVVKNTVLSVICISLSRWWIAALVDLSVVMTSAVASIPNFIYEQQRQKYQWCFSVPKEIIVWPDKGTDSTNLWNEDNLAPAIRKGIVPNGDNVSGPLMFFWSAVLKFFHTTIIPDDKQAADGVKTEQTVRRSATAIIAIIKLLFALMLIVPMIVLVIVNIIRVVTLWLWIVTIPIIIVWKFFGIKIGEGSSKLLDPKQIIPLIFQPVAVVWALSIGFILMIELTAVLGSCAAPIDKAENMFGTSATDGGKSVFSVGNQNANVDIKISAFKLWDYFWEVTGELMLGFFILFLLRSLIKIGFSFSEITSWYADKMFKTTEQFLGTVPIIPTSSWRIWVSAGKQVLANAWGLKSETNRQWRLQEERLYQSLWLIDKEKDITPSEQHTLATLAGKSTTSLDNLREKLYTLTEKKKISRTDTQKIIQTWLGKKDDRKDDLQRIGINFKSTDLNKIWTDPTDKKDAHRLMNYLFSDGKNPGKLPVTPKNEYGPRVQS